MSDALRHRGPDDDGQYVDAHVALGVRRLSVIDLRTGHQPVGNEDSTILAGLNGEIYNYREVRASLRSRGHRFRTASDTEVLVHAYEEYGTDCVARLDGMFAFAIWDAPHRTLLLARDRMGEKPLYYYAGPDVFVFGSELRALLAHPAVPRELSLQNLSRYLAFEYVPGEHAILSGITKLSPAHLLTVTQGGKPSVGPYWDLPFASDDSVTEDEWAEQLLAQLTTSVERRLVSDAPVGFFLSGGIDSSAVVALASQTNGHRPLKTFSLGFAEPSYDERPFARLVAQRFETEHQEITFSAQDTADLMPHVGRLLDEPLVDASFLPIYALSRAARCTVTVALSGDGGDELFCGYPTFLADAPARRFARVPTWMLHRASAMVRRLPTSHAYGSLEFLLKQFFRGLPHPPELRTQLLLGGLTLAEQSELFAAPIREALAGFDPYGDLALCLEARPELEPIERLIYQHCKFYLAGHNLVAVDRASMAAGLEVRSPFLDPALIAFAGRIPSRFKLRGWTMKAILKGALRSVLPAEIVTRRKQGFGVPIGPWLRGPLRPTLEERLAPERVARVGLFEPRAVSRLVAEHVAGRHNHRKILWALLMFEAWRDHYLPHARWS